MHSHKLNLFWSNFWFPEKEKGNLLPDARFSCSPLLCAWPSFTHRRPSSSRALAALSSLCVSQPWPRPGGTGTTGRGGEGMVIKKQLCRGERNESSEPTPLCFGSWSGLRDGGREWPPQSLGAQTSDHSLIKKEDGMRQNIHPDRFSGHT